MALKFTPSSESQNAAGTIEEAMNQNMSLNKPQTYSILDTKKTLEQELVSSDEINRLVSTIDVNNTATVVKFGNEVASEISKASDQVLNSMNMRQIDDSGTLLNALANVMEQFDVKELKEEKKGVLASIRKNIDKILAKYHTMGEDVDKIYVELKKYETEIGEANKKLAMLYEANIGYYKELLKYIMAGEQACTELNAYIEEFKVKVQNNPDSGTIALDLQTLEQTRSIMEQRVMDLKIAENVAMQTVPMLKSMEFSNTNLIRKINSAFIITMPVFKQSLAQAIMLKRQRLQAESMKALDDKTNELLIKNAQNTIEQTKFTTQISKTNSIQVETLEMTWQFIVSCIEDTKRLQIEARTKRIDDAQRLQKIKDEYKEKMNG